MRKFYFFLLLLTVIFTAGFLYRYVNLKQPQEKVYVAVEGEGKIIAFDAATRRIVSSIDLSVEHRGGRMMFAPHNIQVAPDMKSVWVTANASKHQDHSSLIPNARAHGEVEKGGEEPDEVIIIDPLKDQIIKRIPIAVGIHLAHVVLTPDSSLAYVTAQHEGMLYGIDTKTFEVVDRIHLLSEGEPHGIRLAPSGTVAYIAFLKGKIMGTFKLKDAGFDGVNLSGSVVQTGVTPDGRFVVASIYDSKQLALFDAQRIQTSELWLINLPATSRGPIQMYPTPDSRYMYLADQGYYFNQPIGEWVYKIDLEKGIVVKEIKAGQGPHGVVVSSDGKLVYVTNLLSGDVSIIDAATDEEIGRVKVGQEPNGISVWRNQ